MLKRLVNRSEEIVDERLRRVCGEFGARVYVKIRIADVCAIDASGISAEEYGFALRAHFDFVVTDDDHRPLFVVEYDGPSHDSPEQVARDSIKNHLCAHFELPLLRCRSAHLQQSHDGWDLLSWLVDVWFMHKAADEMQAAGSLPPDYDFDPSSVVNHPSHPGQFPYWIGLKSQLRLQALRKDKLIVDAVPWVIYHGVDAHGTLRAFASIRFDHETGVKATIAMRSQAFRANLHDPMQGLLINDLVRQLDELLAGNGRALPMHHLHEDFERFRKDLTMLSAFGTSASG